MNDLVSHIEFLLHEHNCVIIPGFGGFVLNTMPARRDGLATFLPPSCELVFNRDLTYNDGLLAQSYMKCEGILFEAAMGRIEQSVQELKRQLREERRVELGNLGHFAMNDDKRFVYKPAAFVQPVYFGLGAAILKPLIQMQPQLSVSGGAEPRKRTRSVAISAAAAAILLLMMFILPVGDRTMVRQSAQIMSETDLFKSRSQRKDPQSVASLPTESDIATTTGTLLPEPPENTVGGTDSAPVPEVAADKMPQYYIIVGVYEVKEVAEKMMENLLCDGFSQRGWMKRPGRIDVYAASFTDRAEAEHHMRKIHKEYPAFRDAWILKR